MLTDDKRMEIVRAVVSGSDRPIGMVEYGILVARAIEAAVLAEQQKQEPVAWMAPNEDCTDCFTWQQTEENTVPLYAAPVVPAGAVDFEPDAKRLAMELECLLLSCNDNAAVSKWWDSAHEALEQHRSMIAAAQEEA